MLKRLSILTSFFFLLVAGSTSLFAQCPAPDSLEVTGVTSSSVDLEWFINGTETQWDIEIVAPGGATGSPTNIAASNVTTVSGLSVDTDYEVWVRASCPFNTPTTSTWVGPVTFTTEPSCYPVDNVVVTDIDTTDFTITWSAGADEVLWNLEIVNTTTGGSLSFSPTNTGVTDSTFNFTSLIPGDDYQVVIQADCGVVDGESAWTDTLFVTTDEDCITPADFVLTGLSSNTASVSWTPLDGESNWEVEIVDITANDIQDGVADYFTVSPSYSFTGPTGLDPENEYNVYVRANCGTDGFSEWTEAVVFTTYCAPFALPFGEPFDTTPLDCWELESNGMGLFISTFYEAAYVNPDGNGGSAILTSPLIDNTGPSRVFFSWSHNYENGQEDTLALYGSFNGGGTWNLLWEKNGSDLHSYTGATVNNPIAYRDEYVPLTAAYDNNEVSLQFRFGSAGNNPISGDIWIDSVGVELAPACNDPYLIEISNVGETTADVDFDIFGSGATSWDYELVESTQNPSGTATGTITVDNFSLSSLTPGTVYTLYLRTNCTATTTDWIGPYHFTTDCAVLTEFTEGFEATPTNDVPMCWSAFETGNANAVVSQFGAFSGNKRFNMSNSNVPDSLLELALISPELSNISGGTHWLRFWARTSSASSINVGTVSDPTDLSTFSSFETVVLTTTYTEYFIDFTNFTGTNDYLALRVQDANNFSSTSVDIIKWQEIPTCFPPDDVVITGIDTTEVILNITPANTGDTLFEVSVVNITNSESFLGMVTDTVSILSNTLAGLNPGTFYEIYVRTVCSATDVSEWSFPYSFGTHCVQTDTIVEGFEILSVENNFPACWIPYSIGPNISAAINTSPFQAYAGTHSLELRSFGASGPGDFAMASTPGLNNITSGTKWLKFYAKGNSSELKIGTVSDPLDPSTFVERASITLFNTYQEYTVPFADYAGSGENITFLIEGTGIFQSLFVDEVRWEDAPACGDVFNVSEVNILANTAEVSWLPSSQDTTWYLEIVNIPGNVPSGNPTDTSTSTSYTFTNLAENSIYDIYVKSSCAGSTWSVIPLTIVTLFEENVGPGDLISPAEDGCGLTATTEVVVEIVNTGGNAQPNIPIEYTWDLITWFSAGSYTDTLQAGDTVEYVLPFTFDFSNAIDTFFTVRTALAIDSDPGDDWMDPVTITNMGDTWLDLELTLVNGANEIDVEIEDSITGNSVYSLDLTGGNNTVQNYAVCLFADATYEFFANDSWGDGWEGSTYSLTGCGGIPFATNGGVSPDNGINPPPFGAQTESTEFFNFEGCADNNLSITDVGGPYSNCGLDTNETFAITILNNGIVDLDSADAELQINFNGNGFVTLSDFPNGLASDSSITFLTSEYDLSNSGSYTIDVSVVFATDEFMDDNTTSFDVVNAPTLTSDTSDFDTDNGLWANDYNVPGGSSWEWGVPTSTILSNGASGSVWATGLSSMISPDEESYLASPCYDFSGYSFPPEVLYDFVYDAGASTVQLQVSTDGGGNWSNMQTFSNTTTWTQNVHLLTNLTGESDVKFRWKFVSGNASGVEGFAFDNWKVIEHVPYTDASLLDLEVGGVTVTGFVSTTLSYIVTLPYGATTIPSVEGIPNAPIVDTLFYDEAVMPLPDTTFITVIAEDTLFSTTYMVIFEEDLPSSNNDLSMITVDAVNISGFNANILTYNITVPFGGAIPNIDGTVADPTAGVSVTQAGSLPGAATLLVTAQDGTTQTYTVNITEEPPSTNAFLSDLTIDGVTVFGFAPTDTTYTASSFATPLPFVGATANDPNFTSITINQIGSIPGVVTVIVVAEDGITTKTYTITFDLLLNINAQLTGVDVNGVPLPGFDTNTYSYTMELPYGTPVPVVTATLEDPLASYVVNDAAQIPGTSVVVVTAQNGVIIQQYTIVWTEVLPNNDAHLTSISLGNTVVGTMTPAFGTNVLSYLICLGDGDPEIPVINVILADSNASYNPILPDSVPGDYIIEVTAQDGISITTYILQLRNCDPLTLEEDLSELAIYPNPSQGSIVVQTNLETESFKMELINQLGAVVFSKDESQIQLNESIELDELSNGLYILRLLINNTWYTERITIMR